VVASPDASPLASGAAAGSDERHDFGRCVGAGERIFSEGEAGDTCFVIQSGRVELTRAGPIGARLVARLGPGELFGEAGMLLGRPRTVSATAVSDARLLELDAETFEAMCVDRPMIVLRLVRRLAERVVQLEERLAALGADDLLRPLVRALLRRAEPAEGGAAVRARLRERAEDAGLSILECYRVLNRLLEDKVVRIVGDELAVPDLEALSATLDR
jgi:CRP-like cAMP-binding protein